MPTTREQIRAHVRWMVRRDMDQVLDAEAKEPDGWTEDDILRCLRHRNSIGFVAEVGDRVIGYMMYELHPSHLTALRLAIHQGFRRQGVGSRLIGKLVGKLSDCCRTSIEVDVPDGNLPAHLFLRSLGFRATAVSVEDKCDVYRFEYRLK